MWTPATRRQHIRIHANPEKPPTNTRLMAGRPSRPLDSARSPARSPESRTTGVHFDPRTHPTHDAELRPRADRDLAACAPPALRQEREGARRGPGRQDCRQHGRVRLDRALPRGRGRGADRRPWARACRDAAGADGGTGDRARSSDRPATRIGPRPTERPGTTVRRGSNSTTASSLQPWPRPSPRMRPGTAGTPPAARRCWRPAGRRPAPSSISRSSG